MREPTRYFGYGENTSQEMMEAIIGRRPKGYVAVAYKWELVVLSWSDIPEMFKNRLMKRWRFYGGLFEKPSESSFRTYAIREAIGEAGDSVVQGYVWLVTQKERDLIKEWKLVPRKACSDPSWYAVDEISVNTFFGERTRKATTEIINQWNVGKVVDGKNYEKFLNEKYSMLGISRMVRKEILGEE
jgi:hypothetical protein